MTDKKIINLGILAHVDAGKTTLAEQMLFNSGSIKEAGSVDKGTSRTDQLDVEKERGISVRSASVSFNWKDTQINLIDTPGHIDFSAEVERTLHVVDCAVLVVSAVEGVQAQTETIWQALNEMKIPTCIVINKIDRVGADSKKVFDAISSELTNNAVLFNEPVEQGENNASLKSIVLAENENLIAKLAEKDEALMEKFINEEPIDIELLKNVLRSSIAKSEIVPVICSIAKNNIGVVELLDLLNDYFPSASKNVDEQVSALVYKIEHDPKLGRMAGVRLFAGTLTNRDEVFNYTSQKIEKITQIKKYYSDKYEDVGKLTAGDIGFVLGLSEAKIGDELGDPSKIPAGYNLCEPLLTVQVSPQVEKDYAALAEALQMLASEDPHLNFTWFKEERELQLNIMGKIQIEILTSVLQNRFGIEANFKPPTVIYKETPSRKGIGFERYTMPKPCWAVVKFEIEPGERGSGIVYESKVGVNKIHQKYQNEIALILPETLKQGIKGWNVTDIKVTLIDGEDHVMHSRPGDFKLASFMGILNGLVETNTDLLEPMISFKISAPEEYLGKITSDIISMRGTFEPAEIGSGSFVLSGRYPLSESLDYFIRLSSLTGGKAKLTNKFGGYEKCSDELGVIREYKGINPLDRSKFILKWRGALS